MTAIYNILLNTPWWVLALFAVLVLLGIQALRPRTVPVWRLLVVPIIFIAWGIVSLVRQSSSSFLLFDWLLAAAVGGALARITTRPGEMRIERAGVALPGSVLPLARNMLIFFAKYALAAAAATTPAQRAQLAVWDIAVSGLSAGYFLGWLVHFALVYRRASRGVLAVQTSDATR
jgi:hypothetical protein